MLRRFLHSDTVVVPSSQLRQGDIVSTHGMLVLLDGPIQSRDYGSNGPDVVYWQRGLVINIDQVDDPWLVGMTREFQPWPNRAIPTGEHRWTIQGNDLARWAVVLHGPQTAERAAEDAGIDA